jgi:hypothetical protein
MIRLLVQELLPQTEQQAPPECGQKVNGTVHPSNYPSAIVSYPAVVDDGFDA